MKKYSVYIIVFLIGIFVFFLQFNHNRRYEPYTYYQVYLDDEKIGVIRSKDEFDRYVSSQGTVVKDQVNKYKDQVAVISSVDNSMKKIINTKSKYYKDYRNLTIYESIYNELASYVDEDGNVTGNYQKLEALYNTFIDEFKADSVLTAKKLKNYSSVQEVFNRHIKELKDPIVNYINDNKNSLSLTSSEKNNLEVYFNNKYDEVTYSRYAFMKEFAADNEVYLHTSDIYEPLGIHIKRISTYNNDYMKVADAYSKIIDRKPCTVEGYRFKIKKSLDITLDGNVLTGTLAFTDYDKVSIKQSEDLIVYVTDEKVFKNAIDEVATIFIGKDKYQAYMDNKQKEITDTGTKINNVYLQEDITIKKTNVSVKEKIYSDSSSLATYLLYGDNKVTKTVLATAKDTVTSLALKNGISVEEFFLSNPSFTSVNNIFYEGQPVTITKINPKLSLVVEEYQVDNKEVNYNTIEKYDNTLNLGMEKVEQTGARGLMQVAQNVQKVNGQIFYVEPVSNKTIKSARDKIIRVGTKNVPRIGSTGSWGWPTRSGYTLSSYFGWRTYPFNKNKREFHAGLDIAGTGYGSPVYASNNGVIEKMARDRWNYGTHMIINHNNGFWTLYGHMSGFVKGLKEGSTVTRGQQIGYVGATGAATGPHLHFEIRVGANKYANVVDPLPYLRK